VTLPWSAHCDVSFPRASVDAFGALRGVAMGSVASIAVGVFALAVLMAAGAGGQSDARKK
jgi:uncharacterized membrane protein YedE/YeeE